MAAHHPPLLTAEDATAYRTHRIDRVERLNGALIQELDAQLTWWLIKEAFDRHPDLGAFEMDDGIDPDDDDGRYRSLNSIGVEVFSVGDHTRTEQTPPHLLEAQKDIRDTLIGYGIVTTDGFYDLLETASVDREGLADWHWGHFGTQWGAHRTQQRLDETLPASSKPGPKQRL